MRAVIKITCKITIYAIIFVASFPSVTKTRFWTLALVIMNKKLGMKLWNLPFMYSIVIINVSLIVKPQCTVFFRNVTFSHGFVV